MMNDRMEMAWQSLRLAFFLGPFLAGLDKFFHVLVNWDKYLSPIAQRVLGGYSHPFMLLVGVVEICVGLLMLSRFTRPAAYIASIWLLLIAINLVTTGQYYDIALRDIGLSLSAFGLAELTAARAAAAPRAEVERIDVERGGGRRVA
jgi:uncharacterized membrane protein YphA (DoxX/SURF4 family)